MSEKNINLSVIVPVFNEEKTLIQILNQIKYLEKSGNIQFAGEISSNFRFLTKYWVNSGREGLA